MTFARVIAQAALDATHLNVGASYGPSDKLSPGAGVVFTGLTYPIFNPERGRYQARSGAVLILTHECDIDQKNARDYNSEFIFLPLILTEAFATAFDVNDEQRERGKQLASSIGAGHVSRMSYLPPRSGALDLGAFLYFNSLSSSHVSQLAAQGVAAFCALSEHAMAHVDRCLHHHLFRAKAEQLPNFGVA